jgi:prepilin-type N-terminal cleavage/methylation domain-containing protein
MLYKSKVRNPNQIKFNKIKKHAFTLAEILIAIGIIGVVSALTIPNLIENYQKRQTIIGLKKTYSTIQYAIRASSEENGDMSAWNFREKDFLGKYFAPYIKLSYTKFPNCYTIKNLRGELKCLNDKLYILPNGTILSPAFYEPFTTPYHLLVDINGISGPNRLGRDVFVLTFNVNKNMIWPYQQGPLGKFPSNVTSHSGNSMGGCNYKASGGMFGAGTGCSEIIISTNWTIPKSYPWK